MELFSKVAAIISRNKGLTEDIKPTDRLREDLEIDSLDGLMIVNDFEEEFGFSIEPEELKNLKVVQDIVDKMELKLLLVKTA
jgi:acyl carrier protein